MLIPYIKKMVGVLKNNISIFILLCLFLSCDEKVIDNSEFIENNFLKIVDTVAYRYGAFVLPPPSSKDTIIKVPSYTNLALELNNDIKYNEKINQDVLFYFNLNKKIKTEFKDLLKNGSYSKFSLSKNFPKKIGKYSIFFEKSKVNKKIKYAGRIDINNFKIYRNKAFLVLTESVGKCERTYLLLFEKNNNNWIILKKEILYVS